MSPVIARDATFVREFVDIVPTTVCDTRYDVIMNISKFVFIFVLSRATSTLGTQALRQTFVRVIESYGRG